MRGEKKREGGGGSWEGSNKARLKRPFVLLPLDRELIIHVNFSPEMTSEVKTNNFLLLLTVNSIKTQ